MRIAAVCFALAAVAVACGGAEVDSSSDKSASEQQAGTNETPAAATPAAASAPESDAATTTASDACFTDPGAAAPGACTVGDSRDCTDIPDAGGPGLQGYCQQRCMNVDGTATWSEPTHSAQCPYTDTNLFIGQQLQQCLCNTPLVLSFDGHPVVFGHDATGAFDLTRLGLSHGSDWPTAATPWLALDRDGNGQIDDGGELFGSATRLAAGTFAKNGFEALRDLDANHDGAFDAQDPAFTHVVVWADRNNDKKSQPNELTSLSERGVTSISLHDRVDARCDARGNCEGERASFTFASGERGTVIDVYLPSR